MDIFIECVYNKSTGARVEHELKIEFKSEGFDAFTEKRKKLRL